MRFVLLLALLVVLSVCWTTGLIGFWWAWLAAVCLWVGWLTRPSRVVVRAEVPADAAAPDGEGPVGAGDPALAEVPEC